MARTKLVTVESAGKLAALNGLLGPITTPTVLDVNIIISLINSGKVVYEVNPRNVKEKIRLDRVNVLKANFNSQIKNNDKKEEKSKINTPINTVKVNDQSLQQNVMKEATKGMVGVDTFFTNKFS